MNQSGIARRLGLFGGVLAFASAWCAAQEPGPRPSKASTPAEAGSGFNSNRDFSGVGVERLDDVQSLVIEGPPELVESIARLVEQIDSASGERGAEIEILPLEHANSENLARLLTRVYESRATVQPATSGNAGRVGFIAIAKPNALVIVAGRDEMEEIAEFAKSLDVKNGDAKANTRVFPLQNAPAQQVQQRLEQFFTQREDGAGLQPRVEIVADPRTNSVLVKASPADIEQAAKLIAQLDGDRNMAVNELRIFKLKNAVASELAILLQQSIVMRSMATGVTGAAGQVGIGQVGVGGQGLGVGGAGISGNSVQKSSKLKFLTMDENGKPIESGILEDITVFADNRTNSLMVTAPDSSMGLVAELIEHLDRLPGPSAQLKVFTLRNSDANAMLNTLQSTFQTGQLGQTGAGLPGQAGGLSTAQSISFAVGSESPELSLVPLTFAVDGRTNSVIVSGTPANLLAVEALILKLDSSTARERQTVVYRLLYLTAQDAASALDNLLNQQVDTTGGDGTQTNFQQQIRNEVSIVPEPISNTLLVSSTPRFMEEMLRIIQEIDTRPPQVMIQVLLAQVALFDDEELGIEAGVQSSILFDRGLAVTNQVSGQSGLALTPGFNFNSTAPLTTALGSPASEIGLQGLSNLGLGRSAGQGVGGLIFQASSDNVTILLRALKRQRRLDILTRPQIMTLDNQQARILIGQQVPILSNSQITQFGNTINSVQYRDVGIELFVVPKIGPDGSIQMRVEPSVSSLDAVQSVPIATDPTGNVVATAPIINDTRAETTVTVRDNQTIVLGGLITKTRSVDERKIPFFGDIPVIGWAFKTRFESHERRELLIILTPHVIYNEWDAQRMKEIESQRMSWILSDVYDVHGDIKVPTGAEDLTPPPAVEPGPVMERIHPPEGHDCPVPAEELQSVPITRSSPSSLPNVVSRPSSQGTSAAMSALVVPSTVSQVAPAMVAQPTLDQPTVVPGRATYAGWRPPEDGVAVGATILPEKPTVEPETHRILVPIQGITPTESERAPSQPPGRRGWNLMRGNSARRSAKEVR